LIRLLATRIPVHSNWLPDNDERLRLSLDKLVADRGATSGTQVFVLFSLRKYQEEAFAYGHGLAAMGAIEFGRVESLKLFLPWLAGTLGHA
jgi:hypothetical protein